jgi:hypothetical protein
VQDAVQQYNLAQQLLKERNTPLVMCRAPEERQRLMDVAGTTQRSDESTHLPAHLPTHGNKSRTIHGPLPIVHILDQQGRFTFDDLVHLFPILAHNSLHELGKEVERLEAQQLFLRACNAKDIHLKNLPLAADVPTEYMYGGRAGMRLWMARTTPKVFLNTVFLQELDRQGIQTLAQLTQVVAETLETWVAMGLHPKKKGTRRRHQELSKAVSVLRIGMSGDYATQRCRVTFRYSKRTGAVLYKMLMRGLSQANSSKIGSNKHCSGCRHGTVAHNWDCGSSQMVLLTRRLAIVQEQRAHRPLPRSDDKELVAELTWYEALRKNLHLQRGWGYGANPTSSIVPPETRVERGKTQAARALAAEARQVHDAQAWQVHQDNLLRTTMRRSDGSDGSDGSLEQRFATSPRVLAPLPTRYSVWVTPDAGKQCKRGDCGDLAGGLRVGKAKGNPWARTMVPPKCDVEVQDQRETLRVLSRRNDPLLKYLAKKHPVKPPYTGSTTLVLGEMNSAGKHTMSNTMLEFEAVDVIGTFEERRTKSMAWGVIQG